MWGAGAGVGGCGWWPGGGVMTWKRADWVISDLEIVDATAAAGYPALLRFGVRALGIKHFLKARRTPA